jgi:hypothetical protein
LDLAGAVLDLSKAMNPTQPYRRLPGRSGILIRHSLWMKPDHLLCVRAYPFSQQYRRYYFKDIQALVLTELTHPAAYFFYAFAVLFAIATLLLYPRHPVWATLCGLPALLLFFLGWRTPDCACAIQTRVSADRLPSLGKLRTARRTIALVKAQIDQTQGELRAEALQSYSFPSLAAAPAPGAPVASHELRHCGGQAHWILFALLLVHAALSAIVWLSATDSRFLSVANNLVALGVFLTAILAAILQRRTDLARSIRYLVYGALGWQVLGGVIGFSTAIFVALQLGPRASNQALLLQHPAIRLELVADLVITFFLAAAGIILLSRHQRSTATPPPLAPDPIATTTERS